MHRPSSSSPSPSPSRARIPRSSRRPADVSAGPPGIEEIAGPVEIAVVSPRSGRFAPTIRSLRAFVSGLFTAQGQRLLLLPGAQAPWPGDQAAVMRVAAEFDAGALFETASGVWVASTSTGPILSTAIRQTFGTSAEANADPGLVDALLAACAPGGERTVPLVGIGVGLLACGENNVLRNAQADGNRVSVRHHPGASLLMHVPVVFNGAHTNMGNWGKLNRRFQFLSKRARLCLYATNNGADVASWRSSLGAWYDGKKVADGEGVLRSNLLSTRLVKDADDRLRALVLRLPAGRGVPS